MDEVLVPPALGAARGIKNSPCLARASTQAAARQCPPAKIADSYVGKAQAKSASSSILLATLQALTRFVATSSKTFTGLVLALEESASVGNKGRDHAEEDGFGESSSSAQRIVLPRRHGPSLGRPSLRSRAARAHRSPPSHQMPQQPPLILL